MLIKDKMVEDGKTVHHIKSYEFQQAIDDVESLRDVERADDWWHVGHIPRELLGIWIKEAGLTWDDTEAVRDLIKKKLLSGDFANLRPHQGSY